jgi:hypothetical protein
MSSRGSPAAKKRASASSEANESPPFKKTQYIPRALRIPLFIAS